MRPTTFPRRAALALLALIAPGCAPHAATTPISETGGFSPAIRGSQDGLEVQWWVVRGDVADALLPFQDAPPPVSSPDAAALWASHGLRLIPIPVERLAELEPALGVVGGASASGLGIQRQWLGQALLWTPVVEGPNLGPTGLWMETGPLALPAGRLRILGRAWTEPVAADHTETCRPILRVELAPQHAERRVPESSADAALGLVPTRAPDPADEGLVFRRLALTLLLDGRHALFIVPERPDARWQAAPPPPAPAIEPAQAPAADRAVAPFARIVRDGQPAAAEPTHTTTPPEDQIGLAGPRAPRLPTLGEAMLMSTRDDKVRARAIVVLIPRLPDEFRLLPR